ncbi:hypothetical protein [Lichenifustis flavocetrariae]|uniref:Uncharacterized protein n=1 Tax=Lichenifustis flavocetrariae TaxID=2949735 RepID=A0AA41YTJ2_9HYPH|nr:hypothetical protein [Lichenifustis flavocetrariae]MCW6506956.1 hypothetical protein [Lichenifustis flavocetrariae]
MSEGVTIYTCASSATATAACAGQVIVSGSYGGEYNAFHAAKWGIRGVVLNDAGVGKNEAGIKGLPYLDRIGLPAATADAATCHIADAEHMLDYGIISHVNAAARKLGCEVGQTVRTCAERMTTAPVVRTPPPEIGGGKRHLVRDEPGAPRVICLDAAPLLEPADAGQIVVTGSHAAMFRGRPDGVVGPDVRAIFFSDAGVGLDGAGIARLADLDKRNMPAATASAASAPIGDARAIYRDGIISHANAAATRLGARPGLPVHDFVEQLLDQARGERP